MDIFEKINSLEILKVLDTAGFSYKKESGKPNQYVMLKSDGKTDKSFQINTVKNIATDFGGDGVAGGPFDIIGRLILQQDTQSNVGRALTLKWFVDKGLVQQEGKNKEFVKSLKDSELLEQFDDFKLNGYKQEISSWLMTRGVSYEWIQKHSLNVGEIFTDIGYYENYYCTEFETEKTATGEYISKENDKPKTVGVFLFPCLDEFGNRIGMKIRRKDGKTIRGKKSLAVGKTGLSYNKIDKNLIYIVEGETDEIILRLLGYKNVIGNLGGVQSNRTRLKKILFETSKVVCLYDNDTAGRNSKLALLEYFGRPIHEIEYPIREDVNGAKLNDINDYYRVGYDTKGKWDKLLSETKIIGQDKKQSKTDFIFLRSSLEYYDTVYKKIQQTNSVGAFLGATAKELAGMVKSKIIEQYEDLCYMEGGKPGYFNTLDESVIVKHGGDEEPFLHPDIEYLINNVCGNKKTNSEWIHKAILYKITHINDVYLPAVIMYGQGSSGKGTFINLLSKIFGDKNVLQGLGQRDLEGNFDSYTGEKLIVEYKEIASGNKFEDKKILDKLKGIINERRITVNAKHQKVREVDNIAWFQLSSNHPVPIQLDSKHSGNRRFTVIKTGGALDNARAEKMNHVTFNNSKTIKQYVARLYDTFPEVVERTKMIALDNAEKKSLEDACEGVANLFFEWFEKKYPNIWKLTNIEKNRLLRVYLSEIGEDEEDKRYKQTNFDLGLSHRYEKKTIRIRGKTARGYYINKTTADMTHIPKGSEGEFGENDLNGLTFE